MSAQPKTIECTFYLQVQPTRSPWYPDRITGAKVAAVTKNKPENPRGGAVTVKLTLRLPEQAFLPLAPEAVVIVPDDLIQAPVEVEAVSPE